MVLDVMLMFAIVHLIKCFCYLYQVAYPYVAKRLLTDPNPALRERLIQV